MRAHGLDIQTFSIRPPSEGERTSPIDRQEYEGTFYVLPPKLAPLLRAHVEQLMRHPRAYAKTFGLALKHRVPGVKALAWSVFHFGEAVLVASELERRKITHLHNHFANAGANVGFLASRMLGLTWSLTLHGNSETDYPAGVLLPAKLEAADFAACVSYFGMAQAMRLVAPEHWSKFGIVRCGLDLRLMPPRDTTVRSRPRAISVGRLVPEKGQFGLIEAFAAARKRGLDADLVLVGDGPDRARLEQRVLELGLADSVKFLGRLPEPQTLAEIAASDVLVMSSFIEGLPVVFMEAMAIGLPVIGPCVAGIPDLIEHGVNGLLFAPAAWHELADRLYTMLTAEPAYRAKLAAAGRARIEAEFDINKAITPLATFYRNLGDGSR